MSISSYFRISEPAREKVPADKVHDLYMTYRRRTFWSATAAYSLYYVCRLSLSVVKQPLIDGGMLTASQLGLIGSSMLFVYAIGKFINGFIGDHCNIRRFMAFGLLISAVINLILGCLGVFSGIGAGGSGLMFVVFALLWGVNGLMQSMGSPPGVIQISRWFPLRERGTWYGIFCATPYLGKSLGLMMLGAVVSTIGWQWGFVASGIAGLIGAALAAYFISDTPESVGLPSIQEISGEQMTAAEKKSTKDAQWGVLLSPGIWVIALSGAFDYIAQYAVTDWGIFFLQKEKAFSLADASQIIALSTFFGVLGTVSAGWLSDKVMKGNRVMPVFISGVLASLSLAGFLLCGDNSLINMILVAVFSLTIGMQHCTVTGMMALDLVPRKATGAALGIIGISGYVVAGIQDIISGHLIDAGAVIENGMKVYNFTTASVFWTAAAILSFLIPVIGWNIIKARQK